MKKLSIAELSLEQIRASVAGELNTNNNTHWKV
jgi:hypothetical protein